MQLNSLFQPLRLPKLSKKAWITPKELLKFTKTVTWVTQSTRHNEAFVILTKRIATLWKRSGPQFTFLYLKEVMRLVIRSLSGNPEPKFLSGVMVKRDHNGLPTIIPSSLRKFLSDYRNNQRVVVCILSIISVFRVFPTNVKPSLETITAPFDGITRTFDSSVIKPALDEITRGFAFKLSPPVLLQLETAGPNAVKSAWGASIDALAFIDHPITLYHYIKYSFAQERYAFVAWVVLLILVSSPMFIVLRLGGWLKKLNMGKLSVVYDQAGKARVVAITNWWIQVALKPLHKTIFKLLKGIEQDGTFDQLAPFNKLISNEDLEGVKFHSFDLSAATDRLPIDLQRDILNLLIPNLGTLWANLLAFEWAFKKEWRERAHKVLRKTLKVKWIPRNEMISVRYAVGQPMGAYSSWAMLALTHHVLVRISAHRAGLYDFKDYCILGDDIVIRNDKVADEYFNLMKSLGVSINLSKSVNSFEFAEFAKVWKGPYVNITPIGPGLTLRLIRDKKYLTMYIFEAWKLSLFYHFSEVLALIKGLRSVKIYRAEVDNLVWSSFGLNGFTFDGKRNTNALYDKTIAFCFSTLGIQLPSLEYRLCNTLLGIAFDDNREAEDKLRENEEFFYLNWWRTFVTRSWPLRLLEAILKVLGPGFWVYALSFEESDTSIKQHTLDLSRMRYSWDTIWNLVQSDPKLNLSSIDWRQKKLIKDNSRRMRKIINSIGAFSVKSFYEKSILIKSNKPKSF